MHPGQLALAWLVAQGDDVVPIPGTKRVKYLEQNAAAADLSLSADDLKQLDELLPVGSAVGQRYADMSHSIDDRASASEPGIHGVGGGAPG